MVDRLARSLKPIQHRVANLRTRVKHHVQESTARADNLATGSPHINGIPILTPKSGHRGTVHSEDRSVVLSRR